MSATSPNGSTRSRRRAHPGICEPSFPRRDIGPAGPGRVALPEDMLTDRRHRSRRSRATAAAPPPAQESDALAGALQEASVLWSFSAAAAGRARPAPTSPPSARRFDLPVACGFRRQDLIDNAHDKYVGEAGLGMDRGSPSGSAGRLGPGGRTPPGETTTTAIPLLDVPRRPKDSSTSMRTLANSAALPRRRADQRRHAGLRSRRARPRAAFPAGERSWRDWTRAARADYLAHVEPPASMPGDVDLGQVMISSARKPAGGHHRQQRGGRLLPDETARN